MNQLLAGGTWALNLPLFLAVREIMEESEIVEEEEEEEDEEEEEED